MNADPHTTGLVPALLGVLLLGGCAGMETAVPVEASSSEPVSAADSPPRDSAAPAEELPLPVEEIVYGHFPREVLNRVIMAEMAGQRGFNQQALDEYLALARETRDLNIIKRASRIAAFMRDIAAITEMADLWLAREPDSPEAHQTLAFQMLALGRYGQALDHLVQLQEGGSSVDFRLLTTRIANDQDAGLYLDTLIADFQALLQRFPANQSLRLSLAHLYQQDEQPQQAYAQITRLNEELATNPEVILLEVQLLELMGEPQASFERLEESLREHPGHRELRFHYARKLIQKSDYQGAREQFDILVEQDPEDHDMVYSLALINMELNKLNEAKRQFQRLVDVQAPRLVDAHYYLGFIEEQANNPEAAITHYRQVESGSNFMQAQRNLTQLLIDAGRYQEAKDRLQRLRYTKPDYNNQLLSMEAGILLDSGYQEEAGKLLNSAITAFPNDVQLLYLRSILSQQRNDLDLMERDLRKIIQLNPDSPVAYNSLGYFLADRTQRYEEAYELIQQAFRLAPDDPAIIDSLGWIQYRLGRYEEALENLGRAFELYPDHEVAAHLGEVLWVMGEKKQANQVWQEALEVRPDSVPVRDTIRRLTSDSSS